MQVATALGCASLLIAAAKTAPLEPGVIVTYSSGDRHITRVTTDWNFALAPTETIHPQIPAEFSLTYDGILRILKTGSYSFIISGGGSITIDSKPARQISLSAGDHAFHVSYTRPVSAPARLQLTWSSDTFPSEPLPTGALGHLTTPEEATTEANIERGRQLVQELNCVGCHKSSSTTLNGMIAPDLAGVGSRITTEWITKWLENPQHFRPAARMPIVLKNEQDRRDVATYLASLKRDKPEARSITSTLQLTQAGQQLFDSIGCAKCHDSAKGNTLDGLASKWTSIAELSHYLLDPLSTDHSGRMPNMLLDQGQADALAAYLMATSHSADFETKFPPGDPQRGQTLFTTTGCLNCHTAGTAATTKSAPGLDALNIAAGCLAPAPPADSPAYTLATDDRQAITAYLQNIKNQPETSVSAPTYALRENIVRFNCAACHATNSSVNVDGVPPLSIAGEKLNTEWIKGVLEENKRVRPWLTVRMPNYGTAVHAMIAEMAATSGETDSEKSPAPSPQLVAEGRRLVGAGSGGFSCITCHSFNGGPVAAPEQSRGPELALMTTRLHQNWFKRWVHEPGRIVPNTVMPNFFAGKPTSESSPMISAIWAYLSLGEAMPTPNGAGQSGQTRFVLAPTDRPMVQRCWLDGGGVGGAFNPIPRAIAVGLPGGLSYAFDPEFGQLRYVWRGDFLDMTGAWNGRGDSHGKRMGTPIWNAPTTHQIYVGSMDKIPTVKYRGYQITSTSIEIIYSVNGVNLKESVKPAQNGFVRTFQIGPTDGKKVYFVFAADPKFSMTVSSETFQPASSPAGWDPKVPAIAASASGDTTLSATITPIAEGK
ncbi:MAG TPA: c-type cytochrome [Tepidisphaeraceae bacterium]|jgi:mono/diheme cytochrome c family protein|nr:c-type cytochrome [Tepidisphaeraceae bacterium]